MHDDSRGPGLVARLCGARDGELTPVLANLRLLFNTRAGDSAAAPEFGVPDLADLLHQFPAASTSLQQALRAAIVRHEPRLRGVQVQAGPGHTLEICARLRGAVVHIRAALTASGRIDLR
jgi:type VI secretion system lysozyme-like protein